MGMTRTLPSLVALLLLAGAAGAQRAEPLPPELEGVRIDPRVGEPLPLDAAFVDEEGKAVRLRDYFGSDRPVILNLGYNRCPMLCSLVLNGLVDALKGVDMEPGESYQILSISIDPTETPQLARLKKQNYLKALGRAGAARGWRFLTGREADIKAVADAAGFFYRYDERDNQYAHGAAIFIYTPQGRMSRALMGIVFDAQTVRLSLVEASEGQQGSTIDGLLLWCFHFDETRGTYAFKAQTIMKVGGALVVIAMAAFLLPAWRRRRRAASPANPSTETKSDAS